MVEGRSKSEVDRDYDVSRYWVQQLVKRWQIEGEAAYRAPLAAAPAQPACGTRRRGGGDRPAPAWAIVHDRRQWL